jgi:hypothetical protein
VSKARIDEIEQALVAYLAGSPPAGAQKWTVKGLDDRDLRDSVIIAPPPAVLAWYPGDGSRYTPIGRKAMAGGTRYDVWERFILFVVAQNLRSRGEERHLAYAMIEELKTLCAGAKLVLAGGVETYLWLAGAPSWQGFSVEGATVYALPVDVHGTWDNV